MGCHEDIPQEPYPRGGGRRDPGTGLYSWAAQGCANITGTFGAPPNPTATADRPRVTARLGGVAARGEAPGGDDPTVPPTDPPADGPTLFDDFNHSSHADPRIAANGWSVRSNSGGPGVPGAEWAPGNVTFAGQNGNSVMNLETSTAGTGASTVQTEILTKSGPLPGSGVVTGERLPGGGYDLPGHGAGGLTRQA